MVAMTPLKCFRVKGNEIYTENYMREPELIATCPTDKLDWVVNSLQGFHKDIPVLDWDEPWMTE